MQCPNCHATVSGSAIRCPQCLADLPGLEPTVPKVTPGMKEIIDGKWAIDRKLGAGGMGTVYLAHDLELDRRVALKMMAMSQADNPELVARFEREARIMAKIEHPNVVPVYAVGRRDRTPFIVMKYLEGKSLAELMAGAGPLPLTDVLRYTKQICDGLQFVHDQGVVHRDIKPANIFVSPAGHVTILDLGVAHDESNVMTRSGIIVGTPRYMSPEQVMGKKIDFRADLYSLATVVYEMLTGTPPFNKDSDYSIMKAHIDEQPRDPATLADLPGAVSPVILKALAKQPGDRYQSALQFHEALARAISGHPHVVETRVDARTPPPGDVTVDPQKHLATMLKGPVPSAPSASERPSAPLGTDELSAVKSRRTGLVVAAGLAVVAAIVVVAAVRPWSTEAPGSSAATSPGTTAPATDTNARTTTDVKPPSDTQPSDTQPGEKAPSDTRPGEKAPSDTKPTGTKSSDTKPSDTAPPVASDQDTKLAQKRPAELRLVATAGGKLSWAYVDVDGIRKGTTPLVVQVDPGSHTLVFRREGFHDEKREIAVRGGELQKITIDLRPSP